MEHADLEGLLARASDERRAGPPQASSHRSPKGEGTSMTTAVDVRIRAALAPVEPI
jgi:hypothetical protein